MKKTLAAAALAAMTLTLGACGSGDDAQASKAISDSIMKSQKSGSDNQFLSLERKDADCIGNGFVDKIGTDQLQKYGLITKDNKAKKDVGNVKMSQKDAESATSVLFGCTDVPGMMQKTLDKSGQIPAAMKDCVSKVLTDKTLRPMFTQIFSGKEQEAQKTLVQPMMACAQKAQGGQG